MKITKSVVRDFEDAQKQYGTKTALENLLWLAAAAIMKDIGVIRLKTTYNRVEAGLRGKN